jgi:hypothetical protein
MDRTKAIFDWIFGIENDSNDAYKLYYLEPPNVGLTEEAVRARKEREEKSQKSVEEILAPKYRTMKGVWSFLTQDHALYTAHKLVERGRATPSGTTPEDKALKESYGLSQKGDSL